MLNRISYAELLKLTFTVLGSQQQADQGEEQRRMLALYRDVGLIIDTAGGVVGHEWEVHDDDDDGVLSWRSSAERHLAIDAAGQVFRLEDVTALPAVPDDGVWYTLVVRRVDTALARGTVDVSASSAVVNGTSTRFTELYGKTGDSLTFDGSFITISGSTSTPTNDGTYEVDAVTSDAQLTLRTAIPGSTESGLSWAWAGQLGGSGSGYVDVATRHVAELELVTRTREPAAGDLVICDIKRDSGGTPEIEFIDRRHQNAARLRRGLSGPSVGALLPRTFIDDSGAPAVTLQQVGSSTNCDSVALCRLGPATTTYSGTPYVVAFTDGANIETQYKLSNTQGLSFTGAGTVTTNGDRPRLVALPDPEGTILCIFERANVLYSASSTNGGATWATPAVIWDPTAVDALDTMTGHEVCLRRNGTIVITGAYGDNSAGTTERRMIYSDDYGASWTTNSNEGYLVEATLTATDSCLFEVDGILVVMDVNGRVVETEDPIGDTGWSLLADDGFTSVLNEARTISACVLGHGTVLLVHDSHGAVSHDRHIAYSVHTRRPAPAWTQHSYHLLYEVSNTTPALAETVPYALRLSDGEVIVAYVDPTVDTPFILPLACVASPMRPEAAIGGTYPLP